MAAPLNIPSATAVRTVPVNGGNLFRIALDTLGDPLQWTRIAAANSLSDPFLPAATTLQLVVPPLNLSASASGVLQSSKAPVFAVQPGVVPGADLPINIGAPLITVSPLAQPATAASPINTADSTTYQVLLMGPYISNITTARVTSTNVDSTTYAVLLAA